jgi:hypothetical protein
MSIAPSNPLRIQLVRSPHRGKFRNDFRKVDQCWLE